MTGLFLSAWVLFPAVLLACSAGAGLLVRRLSGAGMSAVLVLPTGFALVIVVCAFATYFSWLAPAAGALVLALAVAGWGLTLRGGVSWPRFGTTRPVLDGGSSRRWLHGRWLWPTLAAVAAFAAVGGPAFLTGTPTWTGYTRIVDIAFQMDFARHLADAGRSMLPSGSSYSTVVNGLSANYPGGAQATLGAIARLIRTDVPWCYQPYLAFAAAMGALAIYALLGRVTTNGPLRALAGAVAIQPNILYGYTLEGGIKEITTAAMLVATIAALAELLPGAAPRRAMLPAAVTAAAAFAAFSATIAPWLGLVLAALLALTFLQGRGRRRDVAEGWGALAALGVVLSVPSLLVTRKLIESRTAAGGGALELGLGNLAAPVSAWSSAGVWLTGDYRYPLVHTTATHAFDVVIVVLAVLGVVLALARRRWVIALLGAASAIALLFFVEAAGPWVQLKAFGITAVLVLALAFAGAGGLWELRRRPLRWLAWPAAALVAGVVLYGNALTYHDTTLAPVARYRALAAIGARYAGQDALLYPEFDEVAEYFLREEDGTDLVQPGHSHIELAPAAKDIPGVVYSWDLNQLAPAYVQSFALIVLPGSPVASRPPSNYDLIERTRYFDVWRRNRPASTVLEHLPLSSLSHERAEHHFCRPFIAAARRAGPGAQVAYAQRPATLVVTGVPLGTHPDYWSVAGPDTVLALGAGTARLTVTVPKSGRYDLWMQGSVGRYLDFYIDGRSVAAVGYEERFPGQFLLLGAVRLAAGRHTLRVVRGNGTLHPGSGDPATDTSGRTVGALVLSRQEADVGRVHVAPASQAARICAAPVGYQWLEILRPGGAPPDALPA